jgi:hypothetical protein
MSATSPHSKSKTANLTTEALRHGEKQIGTGSSDDWKSENIMCAPPVFLRFLRSSAFQGLGFHFSAILAILAFLAIFPISVISVYQWLEFARFRR